MKQGQTLEALAQELTRQQDMKADYVADTRSMQVNALSSHTPTALRLSIGVSDDAVEVPDLAVSDHTFRQMGQRLHLPAKYADMLRDDHPDLLAHTLNTLLKERPERRLVRVLDGRARAFLSDRYRPLDNFELAEAVLPTLQQLEPHSGLQIASCAITEKRMYIKAVFPRIQAEVREGDVVQSGVVISNSEIGAGALYAMPLVYRLICDNGMIRQERGMRKLHTGARIGGGDVDEVYDVFADDTLRADDEATWLKLRDIVRAAIDEVQFAETVERMQETADRLIDNPVGAVEELQRVYRLTDGDRVGILNHLSRGADLSQWGLVNAVTAYSKDVEDYDSATEFEMLGGKVLELDGRAWKRVAEAEAA